MAYSACFYRERHRAPQTGAGPTELLPRKSHPTSQHQVPQPWTLSGSTCASLVCAYFTHRPAAHVLGSRLLSYVLSGLRKGVLGVLCPQRALQVGSAPSSFHTPPQSGHHASVSHSVGYPAFHPCVNIPDFTSMLFTQCTKMYHDVVSLICLRAPP